tara:strand:+ start:239 stop:394 length:156 start_codon:yes stop_codon:yes gene_type:complete
MKTNKKARNDFINLYNPKTEGLGSYDVHYINAYKKLNNLQQNKQLIEREAA